MIDDTKKSNDSYMQERAQARTEARNRTQGLIREWRFKSYMNAGMSADQAATVMGVKIKPSEKFNVTKILEKVREGK